MRKTASVALLLLIVSSYSQSFCLVNKSITLSGVMARHPNYDLLDEDEVELLEQVVDRIGHTEDPAYYTEYLLLLLNTPYNKNKARLKRQQKERLSRSVSSKPVGKCNKEEELIQKASAHTWSAHYPKGQDYYYYVNRDNPLDLHIVVKIRIDADEETKQSIYMLEDLIESHMAVPGFNVDIQWVNGIGEDIIGVKADQGEWATAHNWAGDHFTIAHELFHIFGLDDEYNRIESHADNQYISYETRLHWFLYQMGTYMYADAENGIMVYNENKALPRHVCWSVGLGDDCIARRTIRYGTYHEIK